MSDEAIFPAFDEWSDNSRWKYVIAHELGHQVEGNRIEVKKSGRAIHAPYEFDQGSDNIAGTGTNIPSAPDPVSALANPYCNCSGVSSEVDAWHCLQSIEVAEAAQSEGLAHFFAASVWNYVRGEQNYVEGNAPCRFSYYKTTNVPYLFGDEEEDGTPVVFLSCAEPEPFGHRNESCSMVQGFDRGGDQLPMGSEIDWLTFYWDVTNDATAPVRLDFGMLLNLYSAASAAPFHLSLGSLADSADLLYPGEGLGAFLRSRGAAHAVD